MREEMNDEAVFRNAFDDLSYTEQEEMVEKLADMLMECRFSLTRYVNEKHGLAVACYVANKFIGPEQMFPSDGACYRSMVAKLLEIEGAD